ncbi:MAG: glycosyl hydrolase 53 family protein [Abitibacteriaceae bacterium]|nr:glycosyl hydrolase 53 family protein [Abditibacteriaceae bacterium]MBV9868873.1 glycosyl hydrolase 53 family protein [Abditibacteriaceae bacterium]
MNHLFSYSLPSLFTIIFLLATVGSTAADPSPSISHFIIGADASHVGFFETRGKVYREAGQPRDPFKIMKEHGINCIRLRLFTSSNEQAQRNPYNSINNLAYTVPLAVRVKQAGLQLLLDFHYADSWADPAHQPKPRAWQGLSFEQLEQRMFEYNRDCIAAFKRASAMPDYVQVGNEITPGMAWPDGKVGGANDTPAQWEKLGRLMKAAMRGIHEAAGREMPKLIVHIDRGGDWATTQWFFDHLREQHVEFDIIGQSYYPFWHGTLDDLRTCLTNAAQRYGKPVIVAETDFPWVDKDSAGQPAKPIIGIPPGKAGQVQFIQALGQVVRGVPDGKGIGIFWWAAEYLPLDGTNLAGFEGRSFFDHDGNVLPIAGAFGQLAQQDAKSVVSAAPFR